MLVNFSFWWSFAGHVCHFLWSILTSRFLTYYQYTCSRNIPNVKGKWPHVLFTDPPPVLFEVSCSHNSIQIGGFPWHYIYTPVHKKHKGTHHICSLKDSTLVAFWLPWCQRVHTCACWVCLIFDYACLCLSCVIRPPANENLSKILF